MGVATTDALTDAITRALATPKSNAALTYLCKELSETETQYPGTELRMIFKLVSN